MKLNLLSFGTKSRHACRSLFRQRPSRRASAVRRPICERLEIRNLLSANPISRIEFMVAGDVVRTDSDFGTDEISSTTAQSQVAGQLHAAEGEQVRIRLETTNLSGTPITSILVGGTFLLRGLLSDLRAEPEGVFGAFLDVTYDSNIASVSSPIVFGDDYPNGHNGDTGTPGLIDEVGGHDGSSVPEGELLLFSVEITGDAMGLLTFESDPADEPGHDVLLFGVDSAIPTDEVEYLGTSIQIGALPMIEIQDTNVLEGDDSSTTMEFTVSLSEPSGEPVTVDYSTADDTAMAGSDYDAASGTVTFDPGEISKTVLVQLLGDTLDEDDETLLVNLSNPVGAELANIQAIGTILDDDDPPTLDFMDALVQVAEGSSGGATTDAMFTVTLSEPSGRTVTVNYETGDDTAVSPDDYEETSGVLTFPPGTTTLSFNVPIVADDIAEDDEQFFVLLFGEVNGEVPGGLATGRILNDDSLPRLEIDDITVNEGDPTAVFTVSVVGGSALPITVDFATEDFDAVAGEDYEARSDTLTIPAGVTSGTISVMLIDDNLDENGEIFFVLLSNATNATIAEPAEGTAFIEDDDDPPEISIANAQPMAEGDAGITEFSFAVTLSSLSSLDVVFQFEGQDANATIGEDYDVPTTQGTILAGETQTTIIIPVNGDTVLEDDETFTILLTEVDNATIAQPGNFGIGTILNDDVGEPVLSIVDVTLTEGDSGTSNAMFTVSLSATSDEEVTVDFETIGGTATAGIDFQSTSGTLTFAAGQISQTVLVPINGDLLDENDETFTVSLSNATGAMIDVAEGTGTIEDDDDAPSISIDNVEITEGDGGTVNAVFTVSLTNASGLPVSVDFAATSNTATVGEDFVATSGTLEFDPGVTSLAIVVQVVGDFDVEDTETFFVDLSSASNATLDDAQGVGTILDEDEEGEMPGSLSGVVWVDVNGNGQRDASEQGLAGVSISLTGTDQFGNPVSLTTTTASNGSYSFSNLAVGSYAITETQPTQYTDGAESLGSLGGTVAADQFFLELGEGEDGVNYNFGEQGLSAQFIGRDMFFVP